VKLYYFPVAPNPTKVRVYLAEKGLEVASQRVSIPEGEQREPEHLARNPLGNLPVLELDDGSFLTESLAIIEYFEELHPDPPMIGRTPEERARTRSIERVAELGVLAGVARIVHATRSPLGLPPLPEVADHARATLPGPLGLLDGRLALHPFVAGEAPTVADCTLFAGLNFGRFFGVEVAPDYPNVAAWLERFEARESVTGLA